MNILYVMVTCKELSHRLKWSKDTWINKTQKEDKVLFLGSVNTDESHIGFNTPEGLEYCSLKYIEFFRNYNLPYYDWTWFCADDAFLYPSRLKTMLSEYDNRGLIVIGHELICHGNAAGVFPMSPCPCKFPVQYPSGGGGLALSKASMIKMVEYFKMTNLTEIPWCSVADVSFGFWFDKCGIKNINRSDVIKGQNLRHSDNLSANHQKVISIHYSNEYDFHNFYGTIDS